MIRSLFIIINIVLAVLTTGTCTAFAQDSGADSAVSGSVDAGAALDAALSEYMMLEKNLYAIYAPFHDRAKSVRKMVPEFEKLQIRIKTSKLDGMDGDYAETDEDRRMTVLMTKEPTMCAEVAGALDAYIKQNTSKMEAVVKTLSSQFKKMTPEDKAVYADRIRVSMASVSSMMSDIHVIMSLCVYKQRNEAGRIVKYSVEKTWRNWYRIQIPLLEAFIKKLD